MIKNNPEVSGIYGVPIGVGTSPAPDYPGAVVQRVSDSKGNATPDSTSGVVHAPGSHKSLDVVQAPGSVASRVVSSAPEAVPQITAQQETDLFPIFALSGNEEIGNRGTGGDGGVQQTNEANSGVGGPVKPPHDGSGRGGGDGKNDGLSPDDGESPEDRAALQRKRFDFLFDMNYRWLTESLDATPEISFIFEVHPPEQEPFFIAAYQTSDPEDEKTYREDDISLLAIEPSNGNIVGFSFNGISYVSDGPYDADGVVATTVNGRYYGYGLSAARQFIFDEVAAYEQRELKEKAYEQFPSRVKKKDTVQAALGDEKAQSKIARETERRAVWQHLYGENGVFGYDKKGRRRYQPKKTAADSLYSQAGPHGLVIDISRTNEGSTYAITTNNAALDNSAPLGVQNKDGLKEKLEALKTK